MKRYLDVVYLARTMSGSLSNHGIGTNSAR